MIFSTQSRTSASRALTRLELLVVLATLAVLLVAVLPRLVQQKRIANRIACVSRLKNIGLTFRIFATEFTNAYPFQVSTNRGGTREWADDPFQAWRHFAAVSNELSRPIILKCPDDRDRGRGNRDHDFRRFTNNQDLSYFIGVHAREELPQSILSGDSHLALEGVALSNRVLTFGTNPAVSFNGRRHQAAGNVLLGDGSVQQMDSARLQVQFRDAAQVTTNTLVIP